MKIGDFEVDITSGRISGGWQAVGIMPNGRKLISGPASSREAAEHDIKQQAEAFLYPQRRYDVNRPYESMNSRKHRELSPADEAIVMHQADQLLDDINSYELSLDGNEIVRPECPHCGGGEGQDVGHGDYHCPNCGAGFRLDITQYPAHQLPPAKASFYPSDGGGGGGGGGMTST